MENNISLGLGEVGFGGRVLFFLFWFDLVWFLMRDKAFFFLLTWIVK